MSDENVWELIRDGLSRLDQKTESLTQEIQNLSKHIEDRHSTQNDRLDSLTERVIKAETEIKLNRENKRDRIPIMAALIMSSISLLTLFLFVIDMLMK